MSNLQVAEAAAKPDCPADVMAYAQFKGLIGGLSTSGGVIDNQSGATVDNSEDKLTDILGDKPGSGEPDKTEDKEDDQPKSDTAGVQVPARDDPATQQGTEDLGAGSAADSASDQSGDSAKTEEAPKPDLSRHPFFRGPASFKVWDSDEARASVVAVTALMDEKFPDDPSGMALVDRIKAHIPVPLIPGEMTEVLYLPAPVFGDVFGQYNRLHGDSAYSQSRNVRTCGDSRYEFRFQEGSIVGSVTHGVVELDKAKAFLARANGQIGQLARNADAAEKAMKARLKEKNTADALRAPSLKEPYIKRTVDPDTREMTETKVARRVQGAFSEAEADRKRTQANGAFTRSVEAHAKATQAYDELKAKLAHAKAVIEQAVPQPFQFTVQDVEQGLVRPLVNF